MSEFSIANARRRLSGPHGRVAICLAHEFERAKLHKGLSNSAWSYLNLGAQCALVGLDDLADQVLRKTQTWITAAIELPEQSSWDFGHPQGRRFVNLALCNWLLDNRHDTVSLRRGIELLQTGLVSDPGDENSWKVAFSKLMWACLDAGDSARIEQLCKQYNTNPPPPADRLVEIAPDGGICCRVMARHKLGLDYTDEEIAAYLGVFTPASVRILLEDLSFDTLALLMKILHWHSENTSPSAKDAVRLCLTDEYT